MARKFKSRESAPSDAAPSQTSDVTPAPEMKPASAQAGWHYVRREYNADGTLKG